MELEELLLVLLVADVLSTFTGLVLDWLDFELIWRVSGNLASEQVRLAQGEYLLLKVEEELVGIQHLVDDWLDELFGTTLERVLFI